MSLDFRCSLSSQVVPAGGGQRLVYLLLEIASRVQAQMVENTVWGNLGFVIDVSESMRIRMVTNQQFAELIRNGSAQEVMTDGVPAYQVTSPPAEWLANLPRRIDFVTRALTAASEYLRAGDLFSLVAFAGRAHCLIPAASGKQQGRMRQAARELEYLNLGEGTQMAEGLALGLEQVRQPQESPFARRLILLTDGYTRDVEACYQLADQARQASVKITTMGIGSEFNEDLLIPLADRTGGNAYYLEKPEKIPDAFEQELGAAMRVRYRNVEIKLKLVHGVELRRVYRVLPELGDFDPGPNMDGSYALLVGDFDPTAPTALLIELVLPPGWPGAYRLVQSMLVWDEPQIETAHEKTAHELIEQAPSTPSASPGDGLDDSLRATRILEQSAVGGTPEQPDIDGSLTVENTAHEWPVGRVAGPMPSAHTGEAEQLAPAEFGGGFHDETVYPRPLVRRNIRRDLVIQRKDSATALLDERVMYYVDRVGAFKMGSQALENAHAAALSPNPQERDRATIRLRQAATRLLDMGEIALAEAMLHQAEAMDQSGNLDPEAAKKLRYETRRLTRSL